MGCPAGLVFSPRNSPTPREHRRPSTLTYTTMRSVVRSSLTHNEKAKMEDLMRRVPDVNSTFEARTLFFRRVFPAVMRCFCFDIHSYTVYTSFANIKDSAAHADIIFWYVRQGQPGVCRAHVVPQRCRCPHFGRSYAPSCHHVTKSSKKT